MKSLDKIFAERKSIRKYLSKPVEKKKVDAILEAARIAPSACNAQPWRIVVVGDRKLRSQIVVEGFGGMIVPNKWAGTAPLIIAVCSDKKLFTHHLAERIQGVQYHLIDIGIVMEHMALKAAELGLGTCYIGWFKGEEIKKVLKLPLTWKVECLMTLGYPDENPKPTKRKKISEISIIR
ncbi:nitroreductase family protein [Elusimicrobiota bacterium]